MSNFAERLRLKEQAEEDIYFAKRDRELLEELRKADKGLHKPVLPAGSAHAKDSDGNKRLS